MIELKLSGSPRAAPRPKVNTKTGRVYNPPWYKAQSTTWSFEAQTQLNSANLDAYLDRQPLAVEIVLNIATRRTHDFDNLSKAVTDPLNGIIWHDDVQIEEAHTYVNRGVGKDNAGATINVWEIEPTASRLQAALDYAALVAWKHGRKDVVETIRALLEYV